MSRWSFLVALLAMLMLALPSVVLADAPTNDDQVIVSMLQTDVEVGSAVISDATRHEHSSICMHSVQFLSSALGTAGKAPSADFGVMELYPGTSSMVLLEFMKNLRPRTAILMNVGTWEVSGFGHGTKPLLS